MVSLKRAAGVWGGPGRLELGTGLRERL